jgi:hypothetical protein
MTPENSMEIPDHLTGNSNQNSRSMIEIKIKWQNGALSSVFSRTIERAVRLAAKEAAKKNQLYEILDIVEL